MNTAKSRYAYTPLNPDFESETRDSFAQQKIMETFGAQLSLVSAGEVHIEMQHNPALIQQDGFLHAGASTTLVDSACGYAAYTLMPPGSRVLSIEFKVNMMRPATGVRYRAEGRVVRPGQTASVVQGRLLAIDAQGQEKEVLIMQGTMTCVRDPES